MSNEFDIAPDLGAQLFPEETAEEAVARIVAQNPQKHGLPVEERERRAKLAAIRESRDLSGLDADDALIVSVGGDPNEMMTGNKPRWTVDGDTIKDHLEGKEYGVISFHARTEEGNVKDHETGEVHTVLRKDGRAPDGGGPLGGVAIAETVRTAEQDSPRALTDRAVSAPAQSDLAATCAHSWPDDPDEDTRCPLCQVTFEQWVNS